MRNLNYNLNGFFLYPHFSLSLSPSLTVTQIHNLFFGESNGSLWIQQDDCLQLGHCLWAQSVVVEKRISTIITTGFNHSNQSFHWVFASKLRSNLWTMINIALTFFSKIIPKKKKTKLSEKMQKIYFSLTVNTQLQTHPHSLCFRDLFQPKPTYKAFFPQTPTPIHQHKLKSLKSSKMSNHPSPPQK